MNEMYCTQCGHDPLLQADNDRRNREELEAARARIAELEHKVKEEHYAYTVMAKANDDHMEYIAELEAARRWIPPCDSTPEIDGYYLVSCDGKVSLSYYGSGWFWDILRDVTIEPDYWQLLPAAPEAANES